MTTPAGHIIGEGPILPAYMTTKIMADCGHLVDERMHIHWRRADGSWGRGCWDCHRAQEAADKLARKAELDAMPRCQVPGCKRRGTHTLQQGIILMCGRHTKQVQAQHRRNVGGFLFACLTYTREQLIRLAQAD